MAHANRSNKLAVCFGTTSKTIYTTKDGNYSKSLKIFKIFLEMAETLRTPSTMTEYGF